MVPVRVAPAPTAHADEGFEIDDEAGLFSRKPSGVESGATVQWSFAFGGIGTEPQIRCGCTLLAYCIKVSPTTLYSGYVVP